ncbi:MAG: CsbD family protein [Terracidiphilus sp.]
MNKDRVNGTIDEAVGTAKRKAGQWTGNTPLQVKGMAQQIKGKIENTMGKAKDAVRKTSQGTKVQNGART